MAGTVEQLRTNVRAANNGEMRAIRGRLLFVALSTACWCVTVLFVLFGLFENAYRAWLYLRHGVHVPERAPHVQVILSTALLLCIASPTLAFAAWRWWQNRWRPAVVASVVGYLVTTVALWLREP